MIDNGKKKSVSHFNTPNWPVHHRSSFSFRTLSDKQKQVHLYDINIEYFSHLSFEKEEISFLHHNTSAHHLRSSYCQKLHH